MHPHAHRYEVTFVDPQTAHSLNARQRRLAPDVSHDLNGGPWRIGLDGMEPQRLVVLSCDCDVEGDVGLQPERLSRPTVAQLVLQVVVEVSRPLCAGSYIVGDGCGGHIIAAAAPVLNGAQLVEKGPLHVTIDGFCTRLRAAHKIEVVFFMALLACLPVRHAGLLPHVRRTF